MQQKKKQAELVLVPWATIAQMRVGKPENLAVEYFVKCRYGKKLTCFDLSGLIAEPKETGINWNPRLIAVENTMSVGWTHRWQGRADNPHLFMAVMQKLQNRNDYLLMRRDGTMDWHVLGNELGGQITLLTGGYTSSTEGRWCEDEVLSYEFTCKYQQYMECKYNGETDVLPVENLFTQF